MSSTAFRAEAARNYAERPARQVPGFADLHKMIILLLAERTPVDGRVLVLGAGGGLELKAFADSQPGWTFDGVDPSGEMLELARTIVGPHAPRVAFHQAYIEDAPEGPFDAATSLLTFHFIARKQRLDTLRQIRRRLKLGAPFVLAHISVPQDAAERALWIDRHIVYGSPATLDAAQLEKSREAMHTRLTILAPEEEEAMLAEAGFSGVRLFYAGLGFRGWIAHAG